MAGQQTQGDLKRKSPSLIQALITSTSICAGEALALAMMHPNFAITGLAGWPRKKGSFAITVIPIGPACDPRPSNTQSKRKCERFDAGDYEATDESVSDMELPLTGNDCSRDL